MNGLIKSVLAVTVTGVVALGSTGALANDKNWTPPSHKIYGQ
jgi:hypothetical protein